MKDEDGHRLMDSVRENLIVIGAGGHARVVMDALAQCGDRVLGIVDKDPKVIETAELGAEVLGDDQHILDHAPDQVLLVNAIGSISDPADRRAIFDEFTGRGYRFATVIHPSSYVADGVELEEGVQVMAGAVIQPGTRIGANTIVNTGAGVDHDCRIGAHCHLAPGATLSGGVTLGHSVHFGTGANAIQCVTIGNECIIGAGATVLSDTADGGTYVGVPARKIR